MAVIPQVYMDAVVSIGVRSAADIKWIGTGFFVIREVREGHGIPFLVSNRHVFEIEKSIVIRMKKKDSDDLKECDAPLFNGGAPIYVCPRTQILILPCCRLPQTILQKTTCSSPAWILTKTRLQSPNFGQRVWMRGLSCICLASPWGWSTLNLRCQSAV